MLLFHGQDGQVPDQVVVVRRTAGHSRNLFGETCKTGFAAPVLQVGVHKDPALANVPMLLDLATDPEQKQIVTFMSSLGAIGRSLTLPPKTPQSLATAMRDVFERMVTGDAFRKEAAERKLDVNPMKGAGLQQTVAEMMKASPELAKKAREAIMVRGRKPGS